MSTDSTNSADSTDSTGSTGAPRPRFDGVDALLADARSRLQRVGPAEAAAAVRAGDGLVDIRPAWQRERAGEVPGAVVVERNHLEWRLDPRSSAALPQAGAVARWVVLCAEGYTSSLAADALCSIGVPATDVVGGFLAWRDAGLPVTAPGDPTPVGSRVPDPGGQTT